MCDMLVMDDDALVRLTLAEALRDSGYEVAEARSGEEALSILREHGGARILVADIHLGGRQGTPTGVEIAAEALRLFPELEVVYSTGRPDVLDDKALGHRERMLVKPYRPSKLVELSRQLLAER